MKPTRAKWLRQKAYEAGRGLGLKRLLEPRTPGQGAYLEALRRSDVTVCVGPWGTGKTYLPVALAADGLIAEPSPWERLVVCRPAVPGGGEDLGYLPGDLDEKVGPYLEPVRDALVRCGALARVEARCELVPFAAMRGLTFRDCFVLLDEAQNATPAQMELFLSRMGEGSKVVVAGDPGQRDLPGRGPSGLDLALMAAEAGGFRSGVVSAIRLGSEDIVRHGLIPELIGAMRLARESMP